MFVHKLDRDVALTLIFSASIITALFVVSYIMYGHSGLPIGWDTPRYIGYISKSLEKGILCLIQENKYYYNVVYPLTASVLALAGLSPFTIEIVFPILLCNLIVFASAFLAGVLKDRQIKIHTVLSCTAWFAIYRLGADLHANLLALILLLITSKYFLDILNEKRPVTLRKIIFSALIFLSSFTHIETSIFFTFIFLVSNVALNRLTPLNHNLKEMFLNTAFILTPILPGAILYMQHLRHFLSYTQGVMVSNPPLSLTRWIFYLGPLSIIGLMGLFLMLRDIFGRSQLSEYFVFITSWASTSLAIALAHYLLPGLQIFSERSLILFPIPFLVGVAIKKIGREIPRIKRCFFIFLLLAAITMYMYSSSEFHRVFISHSMYEKLIWLSKYYKFESPPIFIFNDYDEYIGALGDLYDNWIQAIYGDHYSYIGIPSFLLALSETPFVSIKSQQLSKIFLERMKADKVFDFQSIISRKVIIIEDFFLPRPLPKYYRDFFDEVYDGIYVFNATKWKRNTLIIPLCCTVKSSNGKWYAIKRNWTDSMYALEIYDPESSKAIYFKFLIPISTPGNYSLRIRYWDGDCNDIILMMNSSVLGVIHYAGTAVPANYTTPIGFLSPGIYEFQMLIQSIHGKALYASLDYLEIYITEVDQNENSGSLQSF